jgi:hypothetical protein
MQHPRKTGRPFLDTAGRKPSVKVSVRFTRDEFVRLYNGAADKRQTVARFIRERVSESRRA